LHSEAGVNKKLIFVSSFIVFIAAVVFSTPVLALQPLDVFVAKARAYNPQNREVEANRSLADAQAGEMVARALPGVSATATYTRNQWDVSFVGLSVLPRDQLDASAILSVPLVDLAKFARISGANRSAEAAAHQQEATARQVEAEVVQLYYQLAAQLALVEVARKALDVVRIDLKMTEGAANAGDADALDVSRARAEVEQRSQQLTGAELEVALTSQALTSKTGVRPDTGSAPELADDLHAEPAIEQFLAGVATTPSVLAATQTRAAAQRGVSAQELSLVPALGGTLIERYTNATGFLNGHHTAYAAAVSLTWALDFAIAPSIRARKAEAGAAVAREEEASLAVTDAVVGAFKTIEAGIARSRSARAQAIAADRAADIARTRYRAGASAQLDMIQAERDAFAANAARIQADSNLLNARYQLRLVSGRGSL
jgi:outer membrane protein TolC